MVRKKELEFTGNLITDSAILNLANLYRDFYWERVHQFLGIEVNTAFPPPGVELFGLPERLIFSTTEYPIGYSESWGDLIKIRPEFFRDWESRTSRKDVEKYIKKIIVHELVHQLFNRGAGEFEKIGRVTDDFHWLEESYATWIESRLTNSFLPDNPTAIPGKAKRPKRGYELGAWFLEWLEDRNYMGISSRIGKLIFQGTEPNKAFKEITGFDIDTLIDIYKQKPESSRRKELRNTYKFGGRIKSIDTEIPFWKITGPIRIKFEEPGRVIHISGYEERKPKQLSQFQQSEREKGLGVEKRLNI